jgi:Ca2+/Na+ antiporter
MTEPQAGKVPVLDCVKDAWRFTFAEALGFFPAALVLAASAVVSFLLQPAMESGGLLAMAMNLAVGVAAGAIFTAAVLRKAVRGEMVQPSGLALGADEFRLMGVSAALMLMFMPIFALVFVVLWFVVLGRLAQSPGELEGLLTNTDALAERIAEALGPSGQLAFSLFVFLVVGIILVVAARLFVANAATIGERRMVILQVWGWTKGNVLRVIGALLLTMAPAVLAASVLMSVIEGVLRLVAPNPSFVVAVFAMALSGFIGGIANIPSMALGGVLYRGLRPADFQPK